MLSIKETLALIEKIANKYKLSKPYLVGGIPRDIYLNKDDIKTSDLDLTTNNKDVLRLGILTAYELNVTFELAEDGHVTVFTDSFDIDFSSNFISPSVKEHLGMKHEKTQEAFSRDFTINTLHMDLVSGKIEDPTEMAFKDIKKKLIRTPVPPEITMSDDPRRAYRAVNLAVRYGFDIAPELKNYIKDNPKLFSQENIKDRYISVKMIKALKVDPKRTIELLKKLGLFKNVPLVGFFKDILIQNKLLVEYLDENAGHDGWSPRPASSRADQILKISLMEPIYNYDAQNWNQYRAIGSDFARLADWWPSHFAEVGATGPKYSDFTDWYWNKYNTEWGKKHVNPKFIMEGQNFDPSNLKTRVPSFDFGVFDKGHKADNSYRVKPGVDTRRLSPEAVDFASRVGKVATRLGYPKPRLSSGYRSARRQARVMYNNWARHGGPNGGLQYFIKLYQNDALVTEIHNIFVSYPKAKAIKIASDYIEANQERGLSSHMKGQALDFSMTPNIKEILETAARESNYNVKLLDEKDHYHVSIGSSQYAPNSGGTEGSRGLTQTVPSVPKASLPENQRQEYRPVRYKPFSGEAISLFAQAAKQAGLPEEWSKDPGLHNLLQRESGGWVGIPNYTYKDRRKDKSRWSEVHDELRNGQITARSSATGLGQLLAKNVDKFYPSGRMGIGNPIEEAVGMLKYISRVYGDPARAWAQYKSKGFGY